MLADYFELSLKNIRKRITRSSLSILGISIGIMGIIALSGLGEGLTDAVMDELTPLSDVIIVKSGKLTIQGGVGDQRKSLINQEDLGKIRLKDNSLESIVELFSDRDIDDIRRTLGVKQVALMMSDYAETIFDNEELQIKIIGVDSATMEELYQTDSLYAGDLLDKGDQNKCVIGYSVANDFFDREIHTNDKIQIDGKRFIVKGIYKKEGGGLWYQNDATIHISQRDFEKVFGQQRIDTVIVKVHDISQVNTIAGSILDKVNSNHGQQDLFSTVTMTSILDRILQVIAIIQTVLVGIASIALLVASIGIMNMMLTSVIERTHEIGVMKAIGATNKEVLFLFLSEGAMISIIGGIIGIILGFFGAALICSFVSNFIGAEFSAVISLFSIFFALLVALCVGVLFSYYPAKRAATMSPVYAMSCE